MKPFPSVPLSPATESSRPRTETGLSWLLSVGVTSLLVTAGIIGVRQTGTLQNLELAAYDRLVILTSDPSPDPRLLIVGISESDLRRTRSVPIGDGILAETLEKLQQHQPRVIGLDIHRDVPLSSGTTALEKQLAADNVIVIRKGGAQESERILPPAIVPASRIGFSDLVVDRDNTVRRYLLYVEPSETEKYSSFALRVAAKYLGEKSFPLRVTPSALQLGPVVFEDLPTNAGGYRLNEEEALGWQTLLKYRSSGQVGSQVSLSELLAGQVDPALIRDRIVLIGYTAPSVKDLFITPYSALETRAAENKSHLMPGVLVHAQMIGQILNEVLDAQKGIWFLPEWGEWLWILGWSWLGGAIARRRDRSLMLGLAMAMALASLWGIGILSFTASGWLPLLPATIGLLLTGAIGFAQKAYENLYRDSLTGLPNRRSFLRDLERRSGFAVNAREASIIVLFLDIDRFKMFNEGLGNPGGDQVLLTIAARLQETLQSGERLARIGGDEFIIWFFSNDIERAIGLARRLEEEIARPIDWRERELYTSVSIGIAPDKLDHSFRAEEILRDAHIAMGLVKVRGGAGYEIFTPTSKQQAEERFQLETELRQALKRSEFQLYYQPIVSLKTGKLAGFEALIRWPSKTRGFISPGQFIPIAEKTDLIIPLGEWILRTACQQIREWREQYALALPVSVSVNLSSRQFKPELVTRIGKILQDSGIDRDSLKLEITESMMMHNVEEAIELLQQLRDLGLHLSIDDFGTGYSNLSYLHRFPVDTLKVDQSFVRRLHEGEDSDRYLQIVRTVVTLGHNLNLDVVAEGIETEAQKKTLESLECEYGQGYYFSKPLPRDEATHLLARDPRW